MATGTVVIGLGNPLLRDDGAGIRTVRALKRRLGEEGDVTLLELYCGGLSLMEAMVGFERALLVDAMQSGTVAPGTVQHFTRPDFATTRNLRSAHDTSLAAALQLGEQLGLQLPARIEIWGIEATSLDTFGERLTRPVARGVERLTALLGRELTAGGASV